ncbi:MAG: LamG-like jellyroll fold domain-containing protein [Nannocystaceae bacterium]|nr:LamG domain-containing protein [bacterium]
MEGVAHRVLAAMLLPLSVLAGSCVTSVYACEDDGQCPDGFCEASGYCSFTDVECGSGRRYGSFAGDGLGGTCVPDGGTSTGAEPTTGPIENSTMGPSGTTGPDDDSSSGRPTSGVVEMTTTGGGSSTSATATGSEASSSTGPPVERVDEGLIVLYRLDEGRGTTLHDTATLQPPIDLTIEGKGYEWTPDGLRFVGDASTVAGSNSSLSKLNDACLASDALTMEVWLTPEEALASGPPRLVTYSRDAGSRNASWMLGGNVDGGTPGWRGRTRVDPEEFNGLPTTVVSVDDGANGQLVHAVYVHEAAGFDHVYLDGELATSVAREGDFSAWNTAPEYRLGLGNEFGASNRPLTGTLHLAAIYCRALEASEVGQNFQAGL